MKAYYFAAEDRKLRYGDGRKIVVGETHTVDITEKPLNLCNWGLHASVKPLDALNYAPGSILYVVELSGQIVEGNGKVCAEHRTYLTELDAEELLREFARRQALINIEKIKPYCSDVDYDIIITYLKTGTAELARSALLAAELARSAAWSVKSAVWTAAWSAAESAAWSAKSAAESARSTAWSVKSAAWSAARSAAWSTAWSAAESARSAEESESEAWSAAGEMLEDMINLALKDNK